MPAYRFYFIAKNGHVDGPGDDYYLQDDREALQQAKQLVDGHDIEIWEGPRLVAYVVPDNE
jgi:hypothetical protein